MSCILIFNLEDCINDVAMPGIPMTRLIVVLLAITVPIYFFVFMRMLPFQLAPFTDALWNYLFHYFLVPIVFTLTWVLSIYFMRYRLANTVYLTQKTVSSIPIRWLIFYGINALFVGIFFILPLMTPVIAIIGGLHIAAKVIYRFGMSRVGHHRVATIMALCAALVLSALPFLIMYHFIPNYLQVWNGVLTLWSTTWLSIIYGISQCIVNALSFAAPVHFIYYGAQEYDRGLYGHVYTEVPLRRIRLLEFGFFLIFIYIYLPVTQTSFGIDVFLGRPELFTGLINYISLSIIILLLIIRRRLGVADSSTMGGNSNVFVVVTFLVADILFRTNQAIVTGIIWMAFIIFAAFVVLNFMRASPREMY